MYSVLPSFVLGFHGCDESVAEKVFAGQLHLRRTDNAYDWLGHGIYFWENNPQRALEFARLIQKHPERCSEKIKKPAVIGAIINLGHCLNLLDSKNLHLIKNTHRVVCDMFKEAKFTLPLNKNVGGSTDFPLRHLDCAIIEMTHQFQKELTEEGKEDYEFDTVRSAFIEGKKLYENAGFSEENHIQVCVRNPNCIKGYFRVIKPVSGHRIP